MIIAKFCEGRNVDTQAVRKYIIRHPEIFDGHTNKKGREIILDAMAIKILDEKYPLIKPTQVIDGIDPREYESVLKELNQTKDLLRKAESENKRLEIALINKDAELFLLEEKKDLEKQEKQQLKNALTNLEKAYDDQKEEIPKRIKAAEDNLKNELQEEYNRQKTELEKQYQEHLDAEKNRKLTLSEAWKRVFKK